MKGFVAKKWISRGLALFALVLTTFSVNSTCFFYAYQEKLPDHAKDLRKF